MNAETNRIYDSLENRKEVSENTIGKKNEITPVFKSQVTAKDGIYGNRETYQNKSVSGLQECKAVNDGNWAQLALAGGLDVAKVVFTNAQSPDISIADSIIAKEFLAKALQSIEKAEDFAIDKAGNFIGEKIAEKQLSNYYGENVNIIQHQYICDKNGIPIKDPETHQTRKIDFIISNGEKVIDAIDVTMKTADALIQYEIEQRIRERAIALGGAFIKDPETGLLLEFAESVETEIRNFS